MASKLLAFCARVLRPVMEEVVRQQWREEEARRAAMTPGEVQAAIDCYVRSVTAVLNLDEQARGTIH